MYECVVSLVCIKVRMCTVLNCAVSDEILLDLVARCEFADVALVHQMPFTADGIRSGGGQTGQSGGPEKARGGFGAAVEKVYFGTQVARHYLGLNGFGLSVFTGMSYIVKRHALDELGGLGAYGRWLAEDFYLAKHLHERCALFRSTVLYSTFVSLDTKRKYMTPQSGLRVHY